MAQHDDTIRALREAVEHSPENVRLRRHLAETLARHGQLEEAENEFRLAMALAPADDDLKLGLARVYRDRGKRSHALVIVEDLLRQAHSPASAHLLHSRLLADEGDIARAVAAYHAAIDADPEARDADLADRLGIRADEEDEVVEGRIRIGESGGGAEFEDRVERPKISFAHVGGMDAVKEEIRMKIIYPLQHADMFKAYGKTIGGGILMYGPPGCGKTHLARATAGEIAAGFLPVGINDVLEMWLGSSERNLHQIFEQARAQTPCVLFFDEVDALGASRSDMRQSAGRQLINQFLAELDGVQGNNEGVLILAATNAPWHLDSAFRRPGRFDRILFVPPPDAPGRVEILRILCRDKPIKDLDYLQLAKASEGFSGADLSAVVESAVEMKLREAMKTGIPQPLSTSDLSAAIRKTNVSTKEWFSTARNYALYANQGGIYDDLLQYLKIG